MTEIDEQPPPPVVGGTPMEIAPGVHVLHDRRVPLVPNVGFVLGDDRLLVVDTGMGPQNGARIRALADELAGERELLLTLTHFHPEHGFGAQAFRDVPIVYNAGQFEELRDKGTAYVEMFRTFGDGVAAQLEGVKLVEPTETYDGDAHLLDLGGRTVELRTWGLAHTRADQVVWLPDERVLFAGDLVEERCFPIFPYFPPEDADVDGERWLRVLERLEELEPRLVVPGHGAVRDASVIAVVREFVTRLRDETRALAEEGVGVEEAVERLDAAMRALHPDWVQPEWIGFAVRHFHDAWSSTE